MPDVRYTVPGIGQGPSAGLTAFMPHFNRQAAGGAQQYKYAIDGWPGTVAHPVTAKVDTQISPDAGDKAQMGYARSSDAPDVWYPQDWQQTVAIERPGAGMPIKVYSPTQPGLTTVLPVPATDLRALYQRDSARISRRAVLNRVKQLPYFPRIYKAGDGSFNG
jgi:hypothetical protein